MSAAPVVVPPQPTHSLPTLPPAPPDQKVGVLSYLLYRTLGPRDTPPPAASAAISHIPSDKITSLSPATSPKRYRRAKGHGRHSHPQQQPPQPYIPPRTKQPFDYFLVLDVEATCVSGRGLDWCNEIIEFPVVLIKWQDKSQDGRASQLVVVDEFRTFIKPTYRPVLSDFCKTLTGITQEDVDAAPVFTDVLVQLKAWLVRHGLIHGTTGRPQRRFMWCTDGPFDIRDFVVKQCFISKIKVPDWLMTDVMDVRRVVTNWVQTPEYERYPKTPAAAALLSDVFHKPPIQFRRPSLNIASQLQALSLAPFQGRQHSGIDDSRNIARIIVELGRLGIRLESNVSIDPGRKWYWMGARPGEICDEYL